MPSYKVVGCPTRVLLMCMKKDYGRTCCKLKNLSREGSIEAEITVTVIAIKNLTDKGSVGQRLGKSYDHTHRN